MNKSDFDAFVQNQQIGEKDASQFDPKRELQAWRDYLDALYKKITQFMGDYLDKNAAKIEYKGITINEEFSGSYSVQQMLLKIGRSTITFTPIGTMLIGSKGRVDVQGPRGSARLVLINKKVTHGRQLINVTVPTSNNLVPAASPFYEVSKIEWEWKIATPPPDMKFVELTGDVFFEMILMVANA